MKHIRFYLTLVLVIIAITSFTALIRGTRADEMAFSEVTLMDATSDEPLDDPKDRPAEL